MPAPMLDRDSRANNEAGAKPAAPVANTQAQLLQKIQPQVQQVHDDLEKGDFANAWSTALSTSSLYGTNYNGATTDPLLQVMESGKNLQQFAPDIKWTAAETNAFYTALGNNPVYQGKTTAGLDGKPESLDKNPYGTWGDVGAVTPLVTMLKSIKAQPVITALQT